MKDELVSIVVPTFNRAYCLADTVDSALAQTHPNLEVIVIDDGSKDGTRELVEQRYRGEPRVRYQYQENAGVVAARNAGFRLVQGQYMALLDSDDLWFPWKLELQLACFARRQDVGMVWSDMEAVDPDGNLISACHLRKMYHAWSFFTAEGMFGAGTPVSKIVKDAGGTLASQIASGKIPGDAKYYTGSIFSQKLLGNLVHTSTTVLRRERLEKVGDFNPNFLVVGEDYDFHLRTCREGPVGFLDLPTMRYQTGRPDQLTRPSYFKHVAINTLTTIQLVLDSGAPIDLPPKMLRGRMAELHQWVADSMLVEGNRSVGREHLIKSLRYDPWRKKPWELLAVACLPVSLDQFFRKAYRKFKPRTAER